MPDTHSSNGPSEQSGVARMRSLAIGALTALLTAAFVFWSGWPAPTDGTAAAAGGDVLVATSVCEAHQLRAQKEEDPHLEIEIPAAYDKQLSLIHI